MPATIAVAVVFGDGRTFTDRWFDDLVDATRYALALADCAEAQLKSSVPTKVRIIDQGRLVLALRVFAGGLCASDALSKSGRESPDIRS